MEYLERTGLKHLEHNGYYVRHYMNCFDHECYQKIAEVADSSPFLARAFVVAKAVLEFFQVIIVSLLQLIEELSRFAYDKGDFQKVGSHLVSILISPLAGLWVAMKRGQEILISPTSTIRFWANQYGRAVENFELKIKERDANQILNNNEYYKVVAAQFIEEKQIADTEIQKIIISKFKEEQFQKNFKSWEKLENIKNLFRGDSGDLELETYIKNKQFQETCEEFYRSFLESLPEDKKQSKFILQCLDFEKKLTLSQEHDIIISKMADNSLHNELIEIINLKEKKYKEIADEYCNSYKNQALKEIEKSLEEDVLQDVKSSNGRNAWFFEDRACSLELKIMKKMFANYKKEIFKTSRYDLYKINWDIESFNFCFILSLMQTLNPTYSSSNKNSECLIYFYLFKKLGSSREDLVNFFSIFDNEEKIYHFDGHICDAFYLGRNETKQLTSEAVDKIARETADKKFDIFKKIFDSNCEDSIE